jgi:hypothetical protein
VLALAWLASGCETGPATPSVRQVIDAGDGDASLPIVLHDDPLRINELMSSNDGAWLDEQGEADDFIELLNTGDATLELSDYVLGDRPGHAWRLPSWQLAPRAIVVLWADDEPEQGPLHLPFKLSASGDELLLGRDQGTAVDRAQLPALAPNESYARLPDGAGAFEPCRYATPERSNGESCEPSSSTAITDDLKFAPYAWPERWPAVRGPLVLSELALRPAGFVEVVNAGDSAIALADYTLRIAPMSPGSAWPASDAGVALPWPAAPAAPAAPVALQPGERIVVAVGEADTSALSQPSFDGVVTLFDAAGQPSDRIDFIHWPAGAALARVPDASGAPRFCVAPSPGEDNSGCEPLSSRDVGDRLHALRTPADFDALAQGGTELGETGVKFIVDMQAGDVVHLLGTRAWALHYSWVRENIYGEPRLDRCDPDQKREFDSGWWTFSEAEYFRVEGRRFLLGTLVRHQNGSKTVEFTSGDVIVGEQMRRAFFAAVAATPDPQAWAIRPIDGRQTDELRKVEGTVPVVGPNAPYVGSTYQPLTVAVGYGVLRFVPAGELEDAELGPNVIVVTDDVPNGSAFTGGLITEAFQTPLAHVSVLSRARNTPNMALRDARRDPRVQPLIGQLVRLEVRPTDYDLRVATAEEADAFWQARKPTGPELVPDRDLSARGVVPLSDRRYADSASIGSKAAGVAELHRVTELPAHCSSQPFMVPAQAFAIPFAHYVEHFQQSGAEALLKQLEQDPGFRADPALHADGLRRVRETITSHPVDLALVAELNAALETRFGSARVRFRSSSNTEDLATFNGAGLHTSTSVDLDQGDDAAADGLRLVWASLWNTRAYDERDFGHVDQSMAAMAVLVHQAFRGEAAQGVAISRNALHATRADEYYLNVQFGEASVTNPAPGVTSDEIVYTPPPREPRAEYRSRSSLTHAEDVLSFAEIERLGCALGAIHTHFQPRVDPAGTNRLFAMQIEFKLLAPDRRLLVKQARPYTFGTLDVPQDCREF